MLSQLIKSADWKSEKHVPVITITSVPSVPCPVSCVPCNLYEVEVSVGKEIPHPNMVEHHIAWIALYYVASGSQLPVKLARAEFSTHGPDVIIEPVLKTIVRLPRPGILHAIAYCNLHGLWESRCDMCTQ